MREMLRALSTYISDAAVTSWYSSLNGRVYLNEAPPEAALPLCVYGVTSHDITPVMQGKQAWERFTLEFTHYYPVTSGPAAGMLAAESLNTLLDNATLSPTGYDRVVLRATSRGMAVTDEDSVRITSTFRAIGQRT